MGNLLSAFIGSVMMVYLKLTSKFSRKGESLLPIENSRKDEKNNVKEDKNRGTNEYQLIKNNDDFEIKSENTDAIDEINKEIKNVNIEFDDSHIDVKDEDTSQLDELRKQILDDNDS
jgi:hypothetical protein